jgi:superfamily II DNA or RNA helicase
MNGRKETMKKKWKMKSDYAQLIARKTVTAQRHGIEASGFSSALFDYQRNVTEFALRAGRAALFLDTGLGKTVCQLEWARQIPGKKLILAPVAVAPQTVREAQEKLGIEIGHSRDGSTDHDITITNYERLHLFDPSEFAGVVLDESSILKSFMGKTKNKLCDTFRHTPYRLCCSATPAPNDYMELGNHSDFLGVMPANEMLSRWFINDTMNFGCYRLKGHAVRPFWEWVASWAACAEKPSDAGGDDSRHNLPPLTTQVRQVDAELAPSIETGSLFGTSDLSATSMHADKRATLGKRCGVAADIANSCGDYCIVWCESNAESTALAKMIPDAVEVVGSDDPDEKESKLDAFSRGDARVMVTKSSIAGFGLNWQHCNRVVFASISYSFESYYQAVRRTWRFGQKRPVHVDVVIASSEQGVWQAIQRKMRDHDGMKEAMRFAKFVNARTSQIKLPYIPTSKSKLPTWITA